MILFKDEIQDRYLYLCSSIKYCPNACNPLKKLLLLKMYGWSCSIHKPAFLDIKFFRYFHHVIWVENRQNRVYLFTGHPVICFQVLMAIEGSIENSKNEYRRPQTDLRKGRGISKLSGK